MQFDCYLDVVKAYEEGGRWIVEGLAATTDFDLQDDIVSQEAIESSAKDLIESSTVLHNHDPDESIGKVLDSKARSGALLLKILVSKTAPDIWQKIKEGVLNKFSIRGKILEAKKKWLPALQKFARIILKMQLVEVSLVAVPANPKARALRWYIEKALADYEEGGGEMVTVPENNNKSGGKGGNAMPEEMEVEEELLEASGDPGLESKDNNAEKGFPPPGKLWSQWTDFGKQKGLKEGENTWEAWVEFCKQNGYPHPYPYPYPKPEPGTRMRQIVGIVDKLLEQEKDEERKKLLSQIRIIAAGASNAYPNPSGNSQGKSEDIPDGESVEKAGRKVSAARLARLKKLLDELQKFIAEADASGTAPDDKGKSAPEEIDLVKKIDAVNEAVGKLSTSLGFGEKEDKEGKTLVDSVKDISKRLETIENTPGERSSLDGQEELADGKGKGGKIWKGLL